MDAALARDNIEVLAMDGEFRLAVRRLASTAVAAFHGRIAPIDEALIVTLARHNPRWIGRILELAFGYAAADGRTTLSTTDISLAEEIVAEDRDSRPIGFIRDRAQEIGETAVVRLTPPQPSPPLTRSAPARA